MIEQIRSAYSDNYSYICYGSAGGECLLVDPVAVEPVKEFIAQKDLTAVYTVNTHSHYDHTGGNSSFKTSEVLAHPGAAIPNKKRSLEDGEELNIGGSVIRVIYSPGHIPDHIILIVDNDILLSGDVLFLSGCGNPGFGGDVNELYSTFKNILYPLPGNVMVYPGHDYSDKNLRFAKSVEPDNIDISKKLQEIEEVRRNELEPSSTLGDERRYNPFFRIDSPSIRKNLGFEGDVSGKEVFFRLRELRNKFM